MADLEKIVDTLSGLKITEAAELVKLLEEKWGVSAAAPVAIAAAPAAAAIAGLLLLRAADTIPLAALPAAGRGRARSRRGHAGPDPVRQPALPRAARHRAGHRP